MFIYIITALSVLAAVSLAAVVAQKSREFDYGEYLIGGDRIANIKQLALALKDVEKVGAAPDVGSSLRKIRRAYKIVCAKAKRGESLFECEKWLYENYRTFTAGIKANVYRSFAALPHKGEARVLHLAGTLVSQNYCRIDAASISGAVKDFNRYAPLTYEEIFSLKGAFEVALIRKIAYVCDRIRTIEKARLRAEEDREPDPRYSKKEGYLYFYKQSGKKIPAVFYSRNTAVNEENVDFAFAGALNDYSAAIGNAVTSLKELPTVFDTAFIISLSPVNAYFERDAGYRESDAESKRQYLAAVYRLSVYFGAGEYSVAKGAFDLAAAFDKHFGEIIFDYRYNLRAHLKGKTTAKLKKNSYAADKWIYYCSVFILQAAFSVVSAIFLPETALAVAVGVLTFAASFPACAYIVERALSFLLPKRPVPRLNYAKVPEEGATAVVVSHYITCAEEAEEAVKNLLALQAVNDEENVRYFLLCDLKESDKESDDEDFNVICAFEKYSDRKNFTALVRRRVRKGKMFGAYERKRGAIRDFNELLLTGDRSKFSFVSTDFTFCPRFVITLDADSKLGAGEVRTAINTALHPLNAKYDMLAFSSVYSLSSLKTPYSRNFSQSSGFQTYCSYDDFYYDLCGRSVFCGKGIYSLRAFHEKTSAAVPDGKILSHDILEGALTVTGSLNLATSEDAPDNFVSDVARQKRWKRGDLLLLPYAGKKYCSDGIYGYIILKNAFSCLAPVAAFVLWIFALYYLSPLLLIGLFFASFAAPAASLAVAVYTSPGTRPKAVFGRIAFTVKQAVRDVVELPFHAVTSIAVIAGTFFDYVFNSQSLLKWKPFAQLQGKKGYASHAAAVWFPCAAVATAALAFGFSFPALVYVAVFLAYTTLIYFAGKQPQKRTITAETAETLRRYAESTCAYFNEVGEGLPCDNIQFYPPNGKSATTSPTNIGYALLSAVCAAELGIESGCRANATISALVSECEKLEKWKGHLYNWYDVATAKPVNPFFVSSADSGNFVAALTVCKGFCEKNGYSETAERCKKLIDETDFSALTDKSRNLLYIGYNAGSKRYEGHYDMLASEARLAAYIASCNSCDDAVWRTMSRLCVRSHGSVLASWSGTAFEYLMPQIFLPDVRGSLITESAKRAVMTMSLAKCCGLWGISESGYYAFDDNANYQYKAHGLSSLALRNADDKCVVTPYASALSLPYAPEKATDNLKKFEACGCFGDLGFYEAMDYTSGKNTVCSSMTHHQGMILCAITNALTGGALTKYFIADDRMRGGLLMLEEKESGERAAKRRRHDFVYGKTKPRYSREIALSEFPQTCLLYGKEYGVVIDDYGCGYSEWRDKDINVFSPDFCKNSGAFGYFICDGEVFSPTFAPLKKDGGSFRARFSSDCAEFENVRHDCRMKVYTPTVISGEVREFTVKNSSDRQKNYEFVFACRTALAGRSEYAAHPAFSDLFVSTVFDRETGTLYMKRKPRESTGGFSFSATMLAEGEILAESNRANLYGRNRDESNPEFAFGKCGASFGDVISPCLGLKCAFSLLPGQSRTVTVVMQCAEEESSLRSSVGRVVSTDFSGYASFRPDGETGVLEKYLSDEETAVYAQKLAAKLLYEPFPKSALLAKAQQRMTNDPVKTLVLRYDGNAAFTKKAVKSAIACRLLGIGLRLVVLYDESDGYNRETQKEICERSTVSDLASLPFVSFTNISSVRSADVKNLLSQAFRVMKNEIKENVFNTAIAVRRRSGDVAFSQCLPPVVFPTGNGGFAENGDYVVTSVPGAPYSGVTCAENGGFVATENGGGFCYFLNSQSNKLTGWSNDPVSDPPCERILVSDGVSVIRVNKLNPGGYVRHAKGYTLYVGRTGKAEYSLKKTLGKDGRIIADILSIRNLTDKKLDLEISYIAEPYADGTGNCSFVFCEQTGKDAVRVVNAANDREYFLYAKNACELITDRVQAISRGINGFNPKRSSSPFNNPLCGATVRAEVPKHGVSEVTFALCDGEETLKEARESDIRAICEITEKKLSQTSAPILKEGDESLRFLFNNLPYQVLSSRINGKCGFYQAGGAVGFRDQLQDCLALIWSDPLRVREHILLCAERQYIEGDVMHWWHSPAFGVRTRISDDRLFLPYVTCEYISHTGDESILDETCGYLTGQPLDDLQEARLEHGRYAGVREKLLLHLQRAIDSAIVTGEHGLLLIGGGDWNDALNGIGIRGRGESVWLTEFAVEVIEKFCGYIDVESAGRYRRVATKLREALKNAYFDGRWARAFTDDGEWLGVKRSKACRTDLLCQCWAEIAKIGTDGERKIAMDAARTLVDEDCGAVRLFDPPFDGKKRYGYISSYPQGVRENGGQYTHAAVWYLLACCKAGDKEEANRILRLLNPVERCRDQGKNAAYKGEPYVLAGDVYTNTDNPGRAGWTWYTGSAAWLYKVVIEEMLGVRKRGDSLEFSKPLLDCADVSVLEYGYKGTVYEVSFENAGFTGIRINGVNYTNCRTVALKENAGKISLTVLY